MVSIHHISFLPKPLPPIGLQAATTISGAMADTSPHPSSSSLLNSSSPLGVCSRYHAFLLSRCRDRPSSCGVGPTVIGLDAIRERVAIEKAHVHHVSTSSQFGDIFTKGLPFSLFSEFRSSLNIFHD